MTLEGDKPQAEVVAPTLKVEEKKPTEQKEKPTVRIEDTPEFRHALDTALGKGLKTTNQQLSLSQAETKAAKTQADFLKATQTEGEERMKSLERDIDSLAADRFSEDPEALKGYRNTRAIEVRERRATAVEAANELKVAELDGLRWAVQMEGISNELRKQYKVPADVLESCSTKEQMETIAKAFPEIKTESEEKEGPAEVPKLDPGVSSGGSDTLTLAMVEKMSPDERFARSEEIAKIPMGYKSLV